MKHDRLMPRDGVSIREAIGLALLAAALAMAFVPWADRAVGLSLVFATALLGALLVFTKRVRDRMQRDDREWDDVDAPAGRAGVARGGQRSCGRDGESDADSD